MTSHLDANSQGIWTANTNARQPAQGLHMLHVGNVVENNFNTW